MKRILVAGATGYLGRYVAEEFKKQGYYVRALARSPEKLERLNPLPDELVKGEVTRPDTLQHFCDGMDAVFSSVVSFREVDYQGNVNLLNAFEEGRCSKIHLRIRLY